MTRIRSLVGWLALAWLGASSVARGADLVRLEYGDPTMVVDLSVGLWAWPVPCDADGDGDLDLFVSCPDKPSNGIWLFENKGGVGPGAAGKHATLPVLSPARRLSPAVHYVLPSYHGGRLRVLTPGREYPDFLQSGLSNPVALAIPTPIHTPKGQAPGARGNKIRHNQWCYADFDGDGILDLVVGIEDWSDYGWDDAWDAEGRWKNGPLHGYVYWLPNRGSNERPDFQPARRIVTEVGPVDTYGCPTPNFADFDRDGDLDLLCGEFLDGLSYFANVGSRTEPRYVSARTIPNEMGAPLKLELQMIVPIAFDGDGDGDLDLVVGEEDGRVAFVENTGRLTGEGVPIFLSPVHFQQFARELKCGALATPVGFDWDGDGDTDILSGNTAGYIEFFENRSGRGVGRPEWKPPRRLEAGGELFRVLAGPNGSIQGPAEAKWGYTTLSVADWDLDGLPDIVFNSIWGRIQWLKNIGTRTDPRLAAPRAVEVEWPGRPPKPDWTWWTPKEKELVTQWRTTPVVYDFTGDSLPDLAVLDTEGYLSLFERAWRAGALALLPGRRAFRDREGNPLRLNAKRAGGSGRRKLCVADWDGDGRFDFLVNSANADLLRQVDGPTGQWTFENAGPLAQTNIEGHDVSPSAVDFDDDGIVDFLGGAEDGHFYFLSNPRGKGANAP